MGNRQYFYRMDSLQSLILKVGGIDLLIQQIEALSNLIRGKPKPEFKYILSALQVFCKTIIDESDNKVLLDAFWALQYLNDARNSSYKYLSIIRTIRIPGNIVKGDGFYTLFVIKQGLLIKIPKLLNHEDLTYIIQNFWLRLLSFFIRMVCRCQQFIKCYRIHCYLYICQCQLPQTFKHNPIHRYSINMSNAFSLFYASSSGNVTNTSAPVRNLTQRLSAVTGKISGRASAALIGLALVVFTI